MLGFHLFHGIVSQFSIIIWKTFTLRCQRGEREHLCLLPKTSALVSCAWPSTCCHWKEDSTYQISNWTGSTGSLESCCPLVVVSGKCSDWTQCWNPGAILVRFKVYISFFVRSQMRFNIFYFFCFLSPSQIYDWKACRHTSVCYFLSVLMLCILTIFRK